VAYGHLDADSEMYLGIKKDWTPTVTVTSSTGAFASTRIQEEASDQPAPAAEEDLSKFVTAFPDEIEVNQELLVRGQQRFNIYCTACHGYSGNGDGLVNTRAVALNANGKATWTTAKSLHDPVVKDAEKNPLGRIFETISAGRNTMGPYGDQIPVADRWAIVAYVKALQETGIKPTTLVEEEGAEAVDGEKKAEDSTNPQP
jgi:mono/diheme cytochrome c family protein